MGDCIRGPRPCQGIKLSRAHKCCRKACRAWPAGGNARCAVRGVQPACHGEVPQRPVGATGWSPPAGRPLAWPKDGLAVARDAAPAGSGERRSKETASAHPPIRFTALSLYRFLALPPSQSGAQAPHAKIPPLIRISAHSLAHSPIRPPQTTPRRRTPKFGAAVARHHFGTKAAPTRRAPTMARSPISAIWQTLYGAAVRRHRPPSRGGLGSPPRPSSLERSYAAHTARESAVRNPAFSR